MKELRIFVEGNDDRRFIENIILPYILKRKAFLIITIQYAERIPVITDKNIQTLDANKQKYIFLSDFDSFNQCMTLKKEKLTEKFKHLNSSVIFIVKDEIESWYLSGVDTNLEKFKEFDIPENTENITKEIFNEMIEKSHFTSRIDFMMEVALCFNFELAMKRNSSFKYFIEKLKQII